MNKRYIVRLSAQERAQLEALISKGKASARKILHAHILLKVDQDGPNWTDEQAAQAFTVHANTVRAIRERFVMEGLESALNRKKQGRPSRERKIDGANEARLIALACGQPPEGRARWTLRLLAHRLVELRIFESLSHETVRRTLKKTNSSLIAGNTGAFRPSRMLSSSRRWRTSSTFTSSPSIRGGPSSVWTRRASNS